MLNNIPALSAELARKALSINTSDRPIFMDFHEPAYGETIKPDAPFKSGSIVPVSEGAVARLVIRERENKTAVAIIPFVYAREFTLAGAFGKARDYLSDTSYAFIDRETLLQAGIRFAWDGWDVQPDDYKEKSAAIAMGEGNDDFAWAEG